MPAGRPWYQRNPTDFIVGTMGWDLELRGAYSLLIDILNERDRPIPDDARFVAGFLGITTRKWGALRGRLLDSGKIIITDDGCLSNPRFERERAERQQAHDRSVAAGRQGGRKSAEKRAAEQADLPLETPPAESDPDDKIAENELKTPRKRAENDETCENSTPLEHQEPRKSAVSDQPPPQASRARVRDQRSELRDREGDSEQPSNPTTARSAAVRSIEIPIEREALLDIVRSVARVGGVVLRPERIDSYLRFNVDIVKAWIADGISIDDTALPAITRRLSRSGDDPIGSIKAYDADVRRAHAKGLNGGSTETVGPDRIAESKRSTIAIYRKMGRHAEADEIEATLPPH